MEIAIRIIYITVWCILAYLYYRILRAVKIERLFEQGRIFEIRLTYVLIVFALSYLTTEGLFKLVELLVPNFN